MPKPRRLNRAFASIARSGSPGAGLENASGLLPEMPGQGTRGCPCQPQNLVCRSPDAMDYDAPDLLPPVRSEGASGGCGLQRRPGLVGHSLGSADHPGAGGTQSVRNHAPAGIVPAIGATRKHPAHGHGKQCNTAATSAGRRGKSLMPVLAEASGLSVHHNIRQRADALNRHFHQIAGVQWAYAGGCSGGDKIARVQRHDA